MAGETVKDRCEASEGKNTSGFQEALAQIQYHLTRAREVFRATDARIDARSRRQRAEALFAVPPEEESAG